MNAGLLLDDFETEAKAHIEKIETAFLDTDALMCDPKLINGVFRAAHSIKGTAGFFSLKKIVAVAHELESVFTRIKEGDLGINEELTDIVLQSADCLKDLVDNMRADDNINIGHISGMLRDYSDTGTEEPEEKTEYAEELDMPFDLEGDTEKMLKGASKRGHKIYYVNINFDRSLGIYYKYPKAMIDNILSIGSIVEAVIDNATAIIKDDDNAALTAKIINALTERDTCEFKFISASVLELDLYAMAIEIDKKYIRLLSKEQFAGADEPDLSPNKKAADEPPELNITPQKSKNGKENISIRLDVAAINSLMDLANEMILSRNQLMSAVSGYKIPGLTPVLHDIDRLTSEIQEKVMQTRMQPVNLIFSKFPRIIRDTAKMLNKDIQVEISGGDVMLDKYLLEALTDPITQLVKNSADHGLENAERRADLSKPETGRIMLNAYMRDDAAIIEVSDDGAGIDTNEVKRRSMERGTETENMQESDILKLVFEPGISTAKSVTNLSGRGIGMDIVKTNIENLGGSVEIESEIDKGTAVRLKMPLTLSVIRTLVVMIDNVQYAVPEINVEHIVRIRNGTPSRRIERIDKSLMLSLNGRVMPVVTMREIAAKADGSAPPSVPEIEESLRRGVIKCLALKAGGKSFALLIDDAIETEETLVKPLPVYLRNCLCYSNVTVLGNGSAIMILNAEGIIKLMGIESGAIIAPEIKEHGRDIKQAIIFKCSGEEYFALEMGEIARIETIRNENIQAIGNADFINIAGESMRVIRPEDFAPVKKSGYAQDKLYMLTLKRSAAPAGLLIGKVLDKAEGEFKLDDGLICGDFISGTSVLDEKILIFLNPAAITEKIMREDS